MNQIVRAIWSVEKLAKLRFHLSLVSLQGKKVSANSRNSMIAASSSSKTGCIVKESTRYSPKSKIYNEKYNTLLLYG